MFNFLKGPQITLKITLDRPTGVYFPGDKLQATLSLESNKAVKIEAGRVSLMRQEDYDFTGTTTSTDSDGNTETEKTTQTCRDELEIDQDSFLGQYELKPDAPQVFSFPAQLPAAGLPSVPGEHVRVRWLVKASLVRKMAADIHTEAEFTVPFVLGKEQAASQGTAPVSDAKEAQISFNLPTHAWVAGETLTGSLEIQPQKAFDATEVRLELVKFEDIPSLDDKKPEIISKVKLAGKTHLEPGQPLRLPYEVQLPQPCAPSAAGEEWAIKWTLKVVLARFLQKDVHAEQGINVYTAR
jgi:hypothetical protein